jgi:hypothetical protein
MRRIFVGLLLSIIVFSMVLVGCSSNQPQGDPGQAVIAYLEALLNKDRTKLSTLSCPEWGSQAQIEADSFDAVTARLDNAVCKETGKEGDFTLVTCTGKIIANYGGEDQDFPLEGKTYQVKYYDNEWRMCGYR